MRMVRQETRNRDREELPPSHSLIVLSGLPREHPRGHPPPTAAHGHAAASAVDYDAHIICDRLPIICYIVVEGRESCLAGMVGA